MTNFHQYIYKNTVKDIEVYQMNNKEKRHILIKKVENEYLVMKANIWKENGKEIHKQLRLTHKEYNELKNKLFSFRQVNSLEELVKEVS